LNLLFVHSQVKLKCDMKDDMLKYAIETARTTIDECADFDADGLKCAETIKADFDAKWGPCWHVVIGRNFGSFVTHETKNFVFFYLGDKAVMLFKAG
jgi:dynein light chain LC8-type